MFKHALIFLCLVCLGLTGASAQTPSAAARESADLGRCLADATTGRDRKDLARWIFMAMAAHPEIRDLSKATDGEAEQISRTMGGLVTRLLADDCPSQVRAAVAAEGPQGLRKAFELLGQMAMLEIMSDRSVAASVSGFERHVDQGRLKSVMDRP